MLGAIAGDVIGCPYEYANIHTKRFPLFGSGCARTDDTVLTVATADAILNGRPYGDVYADYYRRYPDEDYGGSFHQWGRSQRKQPYNSWGNGSAMRVSPVGWAWETFDAVLREAERSAAVTHDHPEGIRGAKATAAAVYLARTTHDKEAVRRYVGDVLGYELTTPIAVVRQTYTYDVSCQGTVPVAVRAFLESEDFEDAIRTAVSVGGDCDTLTCITGAIAHAHYGAVPPHIAGPLFASYLEPEFADVTRRFMERYSVG